MLAIRDWLPKPKGGLKATGTRLTSMEEWITRGNAHSIYPSLTPAKNKYGSFPGPYPWPAAHCIPNTLWGVMTPKPRVLSLIDPKFYSKWGPVRMLTHRLVTNSFCV